MTKIIARAGQLASKARIALAQRRARRAARRKTIKKGRKGVSQKLLERTCNMIFAKEAKKAVGNRRTFSAKEAEKIIGSAIPQAQKILLNAAVKAALNRLGIIDIETKQEVVELAQRRAERAKMLAEFGTPQKISRDRQIFEINKQIEERLGSKINAVLFERYLKKNLAQEGKILTLCCDSLIKNTEKQREKNRPKP